MAAKGWTKPRRGPQRKGPSVLQGRYSEATRKKDSRHPREEKTEGFVPCENGGSQGASLKEEKGRQTRLKKSLDAWGHSGDKATAQAKGRRLLARYQASKKRKKANA